MKIELIAEIKRTFKKCNKKEINTHSMDFLKRECKDYDDNDILWACTKSWQWQCDTLTIVDFMKYLNVAKARKVNGKAE